MQSCNSAGRSNCAVKKYYRHLLFEAFRIFDKSTKRKKVNIMKEKKANYFYIRVFIKEKYNRERQLSEKTQAVIEFITNLGENKGKTHSTIFTREKNQLYLNDTNALK